MFAIGLRSTAVRQLKRLRRRDAVTILDAIERHLRTEPERTAGSRIKRLRGRQDATYRLRVGAFRVFYDIGEAGVTVIAVLHKRETSTFYREE